MIQTHKIAKYGWHPGLPDHRDKKYSAFMPIHEEAALPNHVDLRPYDVPIYDQKNLGACTAHSIGAMCEFMTKKEGHAPYMPSRLFIYYNERAIEGTVSQDSGAAISDGMKVIHTLGVPAEKDWAYDVTKFADKPPQSVFDDGMKHLAANYLALDNTNINELKTVLVEGYPFVMGFTVYESFESETVAKTGMVPMPKHNEQVLGGHAVCLAADTMIPFLDGRTLSIAEMAEIGGEFDVYSCDENNNIVPGKAHSVRKTGINREVVRVTLDNNESFVCTPDHLIMDRDGNYIEAGKLETGTSLLPLYREISDKENDKKIKYAKGLKGYEMIYNPGDDNWTYTHRLIAESIAPKSEVIHYMDFNKLNNIPSKLNQKRWNHKVASTSKEKSCDVYDLTVDKYHNFGINPGVFVHNCAVGFDDSINCFIVRNSWGTGWGLKGYFLMPYTYVTNKSLASDFWTLHSITY